MPVLWDRDSHLLDDPEDLVALAPVDTNRLDTLLRSQCGWFFRSCPEIDLESNEKDQGLYYFPERRIQQAGALISAVLSATLLSGAIVCLLLTSNQGLALRVGMIVLFTCLFAGVVGLLTNARRAEIFGASAAYVEPNFLALGITPGNGLLSLHCGRYAAVLVVFVSNNLTGP